MATQPISVHTRVTVSSEPPVARVTLHNPPLNIIDIPMMRELQQVLGEVESRSDISVLVLEGSERAFSAVVDVKAHTP